MRRAGVQPPEPEASGILAGRQYLLFGRWLLCEHVCTQECLRKGGQTPERPKPGHFLGWVLFAYVSGDIAEGFSLFFLFCQLLQLIENSVTFSPEEYCTEHTAAGVRERRNLLNGQKAYQSKCKIGLSSSVMTLQTQSPRCTVLFPLTEQLHWNATGLQRTNFPPWLRRLSSQAVHIKC